MSGRQSKRFQNAAVLDAGGTGCLARPAIQAFVEVIARPRVDLKTAVGNGAHQMDASSRTDILVPLLRKRGTRGRAKAAVNAVEESLVFNRSARVALVFLRRRTHRYQ